MSLKKNIFFNLTSNALGQGLAIIIQLISLPMYLHFWGKEYYGEWILLSSFSTFFTLTDLGITSVVNNEMSIAKSQLNIIKYNQLFNNTWFLLTILTILLIFIPLIIPHTYLIGSFDFQYLSTITIVQTLVILFATIGFSFQLGLLGGVYRALGCFHIGQNYMNLQKLIEFVFTIVCLYLGGGVRELSIGWGLIKVIFYIFIYLDLKKRDDTFVFRPTYKGIKSLKILLKPSFAFMLFPMGNAIIAQGANILVANMLGTSALLTFTTTRTITNTIRSFLGLIGNSIWSEFTLLFAKQEIEKAKILYKKSIQVSLLLSVSMALFLYIFGAKILYIWTQGKVSAEFPFFYLAISGLVFTSLWFTASVIPASINRHEKVALYYGLSCIGAILVAYLLIPILNLSAIPIAFLLIDTIMIIVVFSLNKRIFKGY
jgi:O-antigen/teichoic acid export membrane protein